LITEVDDWLTFSEQSLLEITAGEVFHDGLGAVETFRTAFRYSPDDIWFYLLAAQPASVPRHRCGPLRESRQGPDPGRPGEGPPGRHRLD
jgi:hypothetical protein